MVSRNLIDCGGVTRHEQAVHFQLWLGDDLDHKLTSSRVLKIIEQSQSVLNSGESESVVIIEYQVEVGEMSLFALFEIIDYKKTGTQLVFYLDSVKTNCLAADRARQTSSSCCNATSVDKGNRLVVQLQKIQMVAANWLKNIINL
ncbi:DUF6428 family protein [Thiomicrorhabdus sediminis]|uniref:Uncharacterized protein n=1 Tax=Thiomicrorhabdus sediminis TaxID=2580412 RepID=A0A4P9K9I6_9GAMM|nr:DUF6428 family protein [Thiomicrorhabdus sediminis]QCU90997.1 hypothetical protein FE785_10360 [Thiomicrorhabdus sediminis]